MQTKVSTTKINVTKLWKGYLLDFTQSTDGLVRKEAAIDKDALKEALVEQLMHEVDKLKDKDAQITIVIGSEIEPPIA